MNTIRLLALALVAATPALPAVAQEKVLREGQVTERALVEALAPPAAAASAAAAAADGTVEGIRTRSFRPAIRPAASVGATAAAGAAAASPAGKASILVTFVTDSADLTVRARGALDVLAGAMKSERLSGVRFTIEGHADPRGGDEYNQRLSTARANSVRDYLIERHGLAPERVSAVGRGSSALLNTQDIAAPENRRVTIVSQQ